MLTKIPTQAIVILKQIQMTIDMIDEQIYTRLKEFFSNSEIKKFVSTIFKQFKEYLKVTGRKAYTKEYASTYLNCMLSYTLINAEM